MIQTRTVSRSSAWALFALLLLIALPGHPSAAHAADGWFDSLTSRLDAVLRSTGIKDPYHWEVTPGSEPDQKAQIIVDDMGRPNDAELLGVKSHAWAVETVPAQVAMGTDTRGCKNPAWWLKSHAKPEHKSCEPWRAFVQWFVVFEGRGNQADNVRVQVRYPQSWYLSRAANRWLALVRERETTWFLATKDDVTWVDRKLDIQFAQDQSVAFKVETSSPYSYHGIVGRGPVDISAAVDDIEAVFTTAQARLVLDDPEKPDQLEQAVWLFQSGADYYPAPDTHAKEAVPPGVGLSRSKRITREWQTFNFATLENARQDYPGESRALSIEQFLKNPPPLE